MLRYLLAFVLVMIMVETNAQTYITYRINGQTYSSLESDEIMMIWLVDPSDGQAHDDLMDKISTDPDFDLYEPGGEAYVIKKKTSSSISKTSALSNYMAESFVRYASFAIDGGNDNYSGMSNELLVKPNPGYTLANMTAEAALVGYSSITQFTYSDDMYHIFFPKTVDANDVIDDLYNSGVFEFVEHNMFYSVQYGPLCNTNSSDHSCALMYNSSTLSDPIFPNQWGLQNDGTSTYGGTAACDINICHAWFVDEPYFGTYFPDGNNVVVAVIDDGVDVSHPDLSANALRDVSNNVIGFDMIPPGASPWPQQCSDAGCPNTYSVHGTSCAGIIAAEQNNSIGLTGVAYNSKLMPIRTWYVGQAGLNYHTAWMVFAFNAARLNGADVINFAFRFYPGSAPDFFPSFSLSLDNAINNAALNGRGGKGCVVVAGSGNDNLGSLGYPASNSNVIAAGGVSMCNERKSPTSCDGQTSWGANYGVGAAISGHTINTSGELSVVAPAVDASTTIFFSPGGMQTYGTMDGTSAATAFVAGSAALMVGANPCLTSGDVKNVMEQTATKAGSYSYSTSKANGMWNNEMGYGRLNTGDAVRKVHNIYKQNETELATNVYMSPNHIFSGRYWPSAMSCKSSGDYIVSSGADVTFYADKIIYLTEGFYAEQGSSFVAEIDNQCDNSHSHYKPAKSTKTKERYTQRRQYKRPIMSSSDVILSDVRVYPNPADGVVNVEFTLDDASQVTFTMLNLLGQKVKEATMEDYANNGRHIKALSLEGLAPGVYFVGLQTPAGYTQLRFVKN